MSCLEYDCPTRYLTIVSHLFVCVSPDYVSAYGAISTTNGSPPRPRQIQRFPSTCLNHLNHGPSGVDWICCGTTTEARYAKTIHITKRGCYTAPRWPTVEFAVARIAAPLELLGRASATLWSASSPPLRWVEFLSRGQSGHYPRLPTLSSISSYHPCVGSNGLGRGQVAMPHGLRRLPSLASAPCIATEPIIAAIVTAEIVFIELCLSF